LSPDTPVTTVEILCRRVQAFTVQYLDGSSSDAGWQAMWDSTTPNAAGVSNTLPQAVMIILQLQDDSTPAGGAGPTVTRVVNLPCAPPPTPSSGLQGLGGGLGS
jgi:hypothetical protein